MAILVDKTSRVLVQGITGREGSFHTERMLAAGTMVVAGTSPKKAGQTIAGVPVFADVAAAVAATGADVAVQFVPASAAAALLEAAQAGVKVAVCVTEGIPVHDMMPVVAGFERRGVRLGHEHKSPIASRFVDRDDDMRAAERIGGAESAQRRRNDIAGQLRLDFGRTDHFAIDAVIAFRQFNFEGFPPGCWTNPSNGSMSGTLPTSRILARSTLASTLNCAPSRASIIFLSLK